ncbi:hypothetical protein HYPBUDRAFT_6928 [Hyphopichia burtonii NRRL Y-1933]|uniref:L domain-like protein n=1 Tax=Hyphopichia burtonii NRRL Y-1933 TaxID=984485 RepID=A0A1E4RGZ4_9ASCO|nr:hypothetical protein HYPBUDRAFT_6928 [Hyphopichia burtonii NRRL Y-1933]ODV66528.1 hypothetical protein HYPBUDRAFT_6928 [Hyphopichia burtonii NRRL Y-1933]
MKHISTYQSAFLSLEVREGCALTNDDLKLIYTTLPDIQELCIEYIGNCAKELANGGLLNFKKLEYFDLRDPFCTNLAAIPLPSSLTKLSFQDTATLSEANEAPNLEEFKTSTGIYSKKIDLIKVPPNLKLLCLFCRASNIRISDLPESLEMVFIRFGRYSKAFIDDLLSKQLWPSNIKEIDLGDELCYGRGYSCQYLDSGNVHCEVLQNFNQNYSDNNADSFSKGSHLDNELLERLSHGWPESLEKISLSSSKVTNLGYLKNLPTLKKLDLENCLEQQRNLSSLKSIDGYPYPYFRFAPYLTKLNLSCGHCYDETFKNSTERMVFPESFEKTHTT